MRAPRAYLAGFGTSGSLLAGAALLFLLASAFIGFHGWPQVGDSPSTVAVSVPGLPGGSPLGTATSPASRVLTGTSAAGTSLGLGTSGARSGAATTIASGGRVNGAILGGLPGQPGSASPGSPGGQSGAPPGQCVGYACSHTSPGGGPIPAIPVGRVVKTVKNILPSPGAGAGSGSPSAIVRHAASSAGGAVHHVTSSAGSTAHHVTSGAGSAVHHVTSGAGSAVHHVASGVGSTVHHLLP